MSGTVQRYAESQLRDTDVRVGTVQSQVDQVLSLHIQKSRLNPWSEHFMGVAKKGVWEELD